MKKFLAHVSVNYRQYLITWGILVVTCMTLLPTIAWTASFTEYTHVQAVANFYFTTETGHLISGSVAAAAVVTIFVAFCTHIAASSRKPTTPR